MTITLSTIMDEVVAIIAIQTGAAAVPHAYGRKELHVHEVCPRVIWMRGDTDSYGPARTYGPTLAHPRAVRSLYTVSSAVEIHFWAETETQFELLRQTEIAAIHRVLHGSYAVTGGKLIETDDAALTLGYAYVLMLQIQQPIADCIVSTIQICPILSNVDTSTGCGHDVIFEFPAGDVHCGHLSTV